MTTAARQQIQTPRAIGVNATGDKYREIHKGIAK